MSTVVSIFTALSGIARRLGVCGIVGVIAGALSGSLLAIFDLMEGGLVLSGQETVWVALILALFSWVAVLFILVFLARLTFVSVGFPSLLNCLITCFALVFISLLLDAFILAWLVGILTGAVSGYILCIINALLANQRGLK